MYAGSPSVAPGQASGLEMIAALDLAQKKQIRAIRVMVELLIEKGVISRDEYFARVNRR